MWGLISFVLSTIVQSICRNRDRIKVVATIYIYKLSIYKYQLMCVACKIKVATKIESIIGVPTYICIS